MRKFLFHFFLLWSISVAHALVLEQMVEEGTLEKTLSGQKIGYYIGSFDPLHLGHEDIAQLPIQKGLCDYVLIYPAWGGDQYKNRTPVSNRLKMLFAVFKDHPRIIVSSLPPQQLQRVLTQSDPSRTLNQKPVVKPAFEGMEFIGIIGSDVALGLSIPLQDHTKETERLKHLGVFMRGIKIPDKYAEHTIGGIIGLPVMRFIVARRKGDNLTQLKGQVVDRPILAIIQSDKHVGISSTVIKKRLKDNESLDLLVNPAVLKIIQELKLY